MDTVFLGTSRSGLTCGFSSTAQQQATQVIGCITVAPNAWVNPDVLEHCIVFPKCRVAILDEQRSRILASATDRLRSAGVERILVMRPSRLPPGMEDLAAASKRFEGRTKLPDVEIGPEDLSNIYYTSGLFFFY